MSDETPQDSTPTSDDSDHVSEGPRFTAREAAADARSDDGREQLRTVIFQGMGAATACWDNLRGAGVFESDRARAIAEDVVGWVEAYVAGATAAAAPVQVARVTGRDRLVLLVDDPDSQEQVNRLVDGIRALNDTVTHGPADGGTVAVSVLGLRGVLVVDEDAEPTTEVVLESQGAGALEALGTAISEDARRE